jgi:mRNA interferase MazF
MVINEGDIFWIELDEPVGSGPGYRHPHVVIQNNVFNQSRINTVVVCALSSNIERAQAPGNVLLESNDAKFSKGSNCLPNRAKWIRTSKHLSQFEFPQ